MVVFNLHFGQVRPKLLSRGRPVEMVHRHTTPKKGLNVAWGSRTETKLLLADALGNIEVTDEVDILNLGPHQRVVRIGVDTDGNTFEWYEEVGLGYPLYMGDGVGPVTRGDLFFWLAPLDEEKYRVLTEEEWDTHGQAVVDSYVQTAAKDAELHPLSVAQLERYVQTINLVTTEPVEVASFVEVVAAQRFTNAQPGLEKTLGRALTVEEMESVKSNRGSELANG